MRRFLPGQQRPTCDPYNPTENIRPPELAERSWSASVSQIQFSKEAGQQAEHWPNPNWKTAIQRVNQGECEIQRHEEANRRHTEFTVNPGRHTALSPTAAQSQC